LFAGIAQEWRTHIVPAYPVPTPIFHITAIDNLRAIAEAGGLFAKNVLASQGRVSANIAYQQIQGRRAVKAVPVGPKGNLHDYVPFYFAPRSPMLMTINSGNVPGCSYRQDDIVHLMTSIEKICAINPNIVFTNANAATAIAEFFDDLSKINEIDWSVLLESPRLGGYCTYWNNRHDNPRYVQRMEKRMAEFLVHQDVPLAAIPIIGVRTENGAGRVRSALAGTGWEPTIGVMGAWYY
jgi:hypothetical protein